MTPIDGRTRRWAGHREARRLELVDAAVAAIEEHGPEVTTEQIATHAGVSRPGLYRHFDGKEDLRAAIAARSVERLVGELEPVWRPSGRPYDMLERALRAHLSWMAAHGHVYRYLKRAALPSGSSAGSAGSAGLAGELAASNVREAVSAHVAAMLGDGSLGAEVPADVAHPLAFGLVGMVDAAAAHWLDDPHGASLDALCAQLTAACWAVVRVTLGDRMDALDPTGTPASPPG